MDDSFQIKCDLTVFKDVRTETLAPPLPLPPPIDLQRHLGNLLASKMGGDVEFEVDGELFTAHRYVLAARSSVFMAELFGPMEPKATDHGHLRIQDMEARVFRCMLHFICTDSLPEIDAPDTAVMAQHLLVAADRYDLQRLNLICEDMLHSSVDVSIAATTLVLAEQHACQGLKAACFEFRKAPGNLKAVMPSDGFQHRKSSCPSLLEQLLEVVAP
jgi:speckle-type POZ protein